MSRFSSTFAVLGLCACPLWAQERKENPEPPSDRCFVVDTPQPGFRQDVDDYRCCTTLVIEIPVTHYAGQTTGGGYLVHAEELIQNGFAEPWAELRLLVYDVDFTCRGVNYPENCPPDPGLDECGNCDLNTCLGKCERDEVRFNGVPVHSLRPDNDAWIKGANDRWRISSYKIPLNTIKFPAVPGRDVHGVRRPPVPGVNTVEVSIDATLTGCWCAAVDWVALRFRIVSPIVLVPGIGTDAKFFVRQGLRRELENRGFAVENRIQFLPPQQGQDYDDRIFANADRLFVEFERSATRLGVDGFHVVAHSKGGLDCRSYLAHQGGFLNSLFRGRPHVLSLSTLGTPHEGSVLADLITEAYSAVKIGGLQYERFPDYTASLAANFLNEFRPGYLDLRTASVAAFNRRNVAALSSWLAGWRPLHAIGSDADLNNSATIDLQEEITGLTREPDLEEAEPWQIDISYQIVGWTQRVGSRMVKRRYHWFWISSFHIITRTPTHERVLNDTLVGLPSSLADNSLGTRLNRRRSLSGPNEGRNHSNIANEAVVPIFLPWLGDADRIIMGDLW